MMSSEDERKSIHDKAMKSVDGVKLDRSDKEQLRSDKIDDCQKSPLRFARSALSTCVCDFVSFVTQQFKSCNDGKIH